jgi:hypothetical protein
MFSTVIVDVAEHTVPHRITLAVPNSVQVANRRRYARRVPTEPVAVRLTAPGATSPCIGQLTSIGPAGLACRAAAQDLGDYVLIGDEVGLELALPWCHELFNLPATVCGKTDCRDGHFVIGLEFVARDHETVLEQLRRTLSDETTRLVESEGDQ